MIVEHAMGHSGGPDYAMQFPHVQYTTIQSDPKKNGTRVIEEYNT